MPGCAGCPPGPGSGAGLEEADSKGSRGRAGGIRPGAQGGLLLPGHQLALRRGPRRKAEARQGRARAGTRRSLPGSARCSPAATVRGSGSAHPAAPEASAVCTAIQRRCEACALPLLRSGPSPSVLGSLTPRFYPSCPSPPASNRGLATFPRRIPRATSLIQAPGECGGWTRRGGGGNCVGREGTNSAAGLRSSHLSSPSLPTVWFCFLWHGNWATARRMGMGSEQKIVPSPNNV